MVAYAVLFLPKAIGATRSAVETAPPILDEVARSLGRSTWGAIRSVTLPLAAPGVAAGALLVLLSIMKELPATLVLRPTGVDTLATELWTQDQRRRLLSRRSLCRGPGTWWLSFRRSCCLVLTAGWGRATSDRLQLRGISKSFGTVQALDATDLSVADGELVAVLGPSGCGKTTMLRVVAGSNDQMQVRWRWAAGLLRGPARLCHQNIAELGSFLRRPRCFRIWTWSATWVSGFLVRIEQHGWLNSLSWSVCPAIKSDARSSCLAGSSRGWRWPGRLRLDHHSSCSMSPLPPSTLVCDLKCETTFVGYCGRRLQRGARHPRPGGSALDRRSGRCHARGQVIQQATPVELYSNPADLQVARFVGDAVELEAVSEGGDCADSAGCVPVRDGVSGQWCCPAAS